MKYVTKSIDKLRCLREVYCEIYIALWSENITKLIRYKSRGNNPVKPFKLCAGYFWSVIQIVLEISPMAIIVLSGVDLMTNESARLMLCGNCVAQSLCFSFL